MSNEWDDFAEMWDSIASEYADKAFAELQNCTDLEELRILDFGCGTGLLSERMVPFAKEIIALDNSEKMAELLRQKDIDDVTVLTALLTPKLIETESALQEKFDLIVASSVCGFLPDYKETMRLLSSLLKQNGLFVQWDWLKENSQSQHGLSKKEVQDVLSAAEFTNITISVPFQMDGPEGTMPVLMATALK